jgi:hypothetical protein
VRARPREFRPAAGRRRARASTPAGTRISDGLSERGRVSFSVERARRGRRGVVWRRLRGGFSDRGRAGTNALRWSGRLRGRALRRGTYRIASRARDAAGNRSRLRYATFRILRR